MCKAAFAVSVAFVLALTMFGSDRAAAQLAPGNFGGVYIDAEQVVHQREITEAEQLKQMRDLATRAGAARRREKLAYVSLPKLFAQVAASLSKNEKLDDDAQYLSGITRLQYVFVYPDTGDLIIAGPAEDIDAGDADRPVGKLSGRPTLQLGDLIAAMQLAERRRSAAFGCSFDPPADAVAKSNEVVRRYTPLRSGQRDDLARDMKQAIGPQVVRLFGMPDDGRLAMACVVADLKLKRHMMGIDRLPLGLRHAIATQTQAVNRFWFEASYEPIAVSADGLNYQFRGPSLKVQTGSRLFKEGGATRQAQGFAKAMTTQIERLADVEPAYADLQNLSDLALLAALIRTDDLAAKVKWNPAPLLRDGVYPAKRYTVPKFAETHVTYISGNIVAGGVYLSAARYTATDHRAADETISSHRPVSP